MALFERRLRRRSPGLGGGRRGPLRLSLMIPRPPREVAPEVDEADVERTELLRALEIQPLALEDDEVFLLIGRDDDARLPVAVIPQRLPGRVQSMPRLLHEGECPHTRVGFRDRHHPAQVDARADHHPDLAGQLDIVLDAPVAGQGRLAATELRAAGEPAPPHAPGPLGAEAGVVGLAEVRGGPCGVHPGLPLAGDLHAARVSHLGPKEAEPVVEQTPDVDAAVQVELVEVDALRHRLGPVRLPDLHAHEAPSRQLRVGQLRGQVLVERHGRRLAHPHEDDAHPLLRRIGAGAELADEGGIGTLDQAGHALPRAVEDVAVIRAGDGALELAEAEGQPRAAVRAPVAEGDDGAGLVAKEDEVVAEHLEVHGLAAHLPGLDGRVPVLPESQPGAVVERPDLRGAVGLLHGVLRHRVSTIRAARRVHEDYLPCGIIRRWCAARAGGRRAPRRAR